MPTTPPNTFVQSKVFACFAPNFGVQSALGTPIPQADLTVRINQPLGNRPMPTRRVTRDETRDCTGRYLIGRRLTSRLTLWTLALTDVDARTIAGFLAWGMGAAAAVTGSSAPYTEALSHAASDQLAATSFIVGAEDSDEPAEVYSDMILNTLDLEATIRGKVGLRASFIGNGLVGLASSFTPPSCSNLVALYAQDCAVTIGGTDYTHDQHTFRYSFNNNLEAADDPFVFDNVDMARLERGEQGETSQFNFGLYGTKTHALWAHAVAEDVLAVALRFGTSTEGTTVSAAGAQVTLGDPPISYAGEKNRSVINLVADPFSVSGAKPDAATYVGATAARLAQAAA